MYIVCIHAHAHAYTYTLQEGYKYSKCVRCVHVNVHVIQGWLWVVLLCCVMNFIATVMLGPDNQDPCFEFVSSHQQGNMHRYTVRLHTTWLYIHVYTT